MPLARLPTGIPGLDEILHGGLMKAGVYLVRGEPGAGKTILANQICFHHVAGGGKAGYITLLAESHARMLEHLGAFSFYRPDVIPEQVCYISAFNALKDKGLPGVTALISAEMRSRKIGLLVLDGLVTAAEAAGSMASSDCETSCRAFGTSALSKWSSSGGRRCWTARMPCGSMRTASLCSRDSRRAT